VDAKVRRHFCGQLSGGTAQSQEMLKHESVDVNLTDKDSRTPLSWAAEKGQPTIIRELLKHKSADPNLTDKDGRTPLLWATVSGHSSVVQTLQKHKSVDATCLQSILIPNSCRNLESQDDIQLLESPPLYIYKANGSRVNAPFNLSRQKGEKD